MIRATINSIVLLSFLSFSSGWKISKNTVKRTWNIVPKTQRIIIDNLNLLFLSTIFDIITYETIPKILEIKYIILELFPLIEYNSNKGFISVPIIL